MRPHRVVNLSKPVSEQTTKPAFRRVRFTESAPAKTSKLTPKPTPKNNTRPVDVAKPTLEKAPKRPIDFLINIKNATFYKDYPSRNETSSSEPNPPLFPNLRFQLAATPEEKIGRRVGGRYYAVIGTNTTPFLTVLQGGYICEPSSARTYPYLSSEHIPEELSYLRVPSRAIKYVGFSSKALNDAPGGVRGAYLSARYESRREETDWSLGQYLRGETELNPSQKHGGPVIDTTHYDSVLDKLQLKNLIELPVSHLSNGQTRRARIAKALLDRPRLLMLDDPFSTYVSPHN